MAQKTQNALVNGTWSRGWEPGDWRALVTWLNHERADASGKKRITRLIELLAEARKADLKRRVEIWSGELWDLLQHYTRQHPVITEVPKAGRWFVGFRPERGPVTVIQVGTIKRGYSESDALATVMRLQETGQDGKLRRCTECKRWIFVRFQRMKFCGKECQEKFYKRNPEFLKKRAAYMKEKMRQYRQADKEKDARFLKKQRQPQRTTKPKRRKA